MTTAIAEKLSSPQPSLSFEQFQTMRQQAAVLIASRFLPPSLNTPEKVISVAMAGRELGVGFMASLRNIYPIGGVPTISPRLMLALAIKSGNMEDWSIEKTPHSVTVTVKRTGKSAHREVFGDVEATALGLIGKDNYKKQKLTMYKWRALSAALNFTFPDVLMGGIYTPEELGAEVTVSDADDLEIATVQAAGDATAERLAKAKLLGAEIIAALAALHGGNMEAMAQQLKADTLHEVTGPDGAVHAEWIDLEEVPALAATKPAWIERLHEKVMPILSKILAERQTFASRP